ncbi:MAG: phenylacetate--CoA ligase family protein [Lautropia sp.]
MDTSAQVPWYWKSLDFERLTRDFPPPPDYFRERFTASPQTIRTLQEQRFVETMERAWQIPFFQRLWGEAGLKASDITGLADLHKIPTYDVSHIRDSIALNPPFGDFMGISPADSQELPIVLQTSGGTTGLPRPMLYSPKERETMAILGGRRFFLHGIRPGDMVLVTYSFNLGNGGFAPREAIWKYTGAIPVTTGSGANTPTRRQIEIVQAWKINVILGFAPYMRHMALVARDELGLDPRKLGIKLIGTHGNREERESVEDLWGCKTFDAYGAHDCGMVAAECEAHAGLHVFDDCFYLEILNPETGQLVPDGEAGVLHITTLYKYGAPLVRWNTNDILRRLPGNCPCGGTTSRLEHLIGRNDGMIKLRGVNVFPEAVGLAVLQDTRTTGEFFCFVDQVGEAKFDEMDVWVEAVNDGVDRAALLADLERRLKEVTGVKLKVTVKAKGELDIHTGTSQVSKIKRVLDRRKVRRIKA